MANGDKAASAGLAVFAGTQDRRQGYDNDNIRGDELATHMQDGGHPFSKITGTAAASQIPTLDASKITTGTLDQARIPALTAAQVPNLPASKITTGNLSLPGSIACIGNMNAGGGLGIGGTGQGFDPLGNLYATSATVGKLVSQYARDNAVTGWTALGINGSGQIGVQASIQGAKQNIRPWLVTIDQFTTIKPRRFRLRAAVKADKAAPYEVGFIAEDFERAGLSELTYRDTDGNLAGLHYERIVVALWGVVQQQQEQINELREQRTKGA